MWFPETTGQLCEIIRRASETGTGLIPLSSGPPHLHGASADPEAEIVCFEKMNRILKIDRKNRYARVEAGVSYGTLLPALAEQGLRANHPFLPRAGKSVAASMLEREAVLVPKYQYDYTDPLLTAEVVYGTGDVFRTGSAAGPGPVEELKADMVCPWGPGSIDFLRFLCGAQGTMGFVTWTTLKTEIRPAGSELFFIEAEEPEVLSKLAAKLLFKRVPDDCIILNSAAFAAAFSEDIRQEAMLKEKTARWILICRISGYERRPKERIRIYSGYLKDITASYGLSAGTIPTGAEGLETFIDSRLCDCDRSDVYWKLRRGRVREILFLCPPSRTGLLTAILEDRTKDMPRENVGIMIQPQVQGRAFRIECDLFHPESEKERFGKCAKEAEQALFAAGAFFDRPYGDLPSLVYQADPAGVQALKKLKSVFDPKGILNPGKLCF